MMKLEVYMGSRPCDLGISQTSFDLNFSGTSE